ncbi:MAG: preprotein translocase subunit SecG [Candidatus Dasytiphilus stammeri]
MHEIILTIFLIVAVILITLILIHHGYGNEIGTTNATPTNASSTFFGSQGSRNFLNRIITLLAFIFIITILILDNIIYKTENQWSNITPPKIHVKNQKTVH